MACNKKLDEIRKKEKKKKKKKKPLLGQVAQDCPNLMTRVLNQNSKSLRMISWTKGFRMSYCVCMCISLNF